MCKENSFSMYVKPEVPIIAKTSKITGLTFDVLSWKAVVCHFLQHVLKNFGRRLASFEDPFCLPTVKLHERFRGFCNILELFRAIFFSERFSLEYLVTHVLKISYNAHDALEDSKV